MIKGESQLNPNHRDTPSEYLEKEAESSEKWEFFDGKFRRWFEGARNHAAIYANCVIALGDRPSTPFGSELKVFAEAANAYLYPDAMVVCSEEKMQAGRNDVLLNPALIDTNVFPAY